jgi:hypothetical protein
MVQRLDTMNERLPFQPQEINSGASSAETFGKMLGSIADASVKEAEDIGKSESNAMLLMSSTQAETLKANTQIDILKNPDHAESIVNNAIENLDSINQNSKLNTQDRQKLMTVLGSDMNDIRVKAAEAQYRQSKVDMSLAFWDNYQPAMHAINEALMSGDFDKAKAIDESLHKSAFSAAHFGAISPSQFAAVVKSTEGVHNNIEEVLRMVNDPDSHTAANFHEKTSSPYALTSFQNPDYPIDQHTQALTNHYIEDRSMSGQYNNLYNDKQINFGVIAAGSEHELMDFSAQYQGVNKIKSAVNAGQPYNVIDNYITSLGKKDLTPFEKGQYNWWQNYKKKLDTGEGFLEAMSNTSKGGQLTQDFNNQQVAIMNSSLSESDKNARLQNLNNNYLHNVLSYAKSINADPNHVQVISTPLLNTVRSSFAEGADVNQAIKILNYFDPSLRPYIARGMPDTKPNQGMTVYLAGAVAGSADTSFQANLLLANQDRIKDEKFSFTESESTVTDNIYHSLVNRDDFRDINVYLSNLPSNGHPEILQTGLKESSTNYVKYMAAKASDLSLDNKDKYINDFAKNVNKGFDIVKQPDYIFNNKTLNLRKVEMDRLAAYVKEEGMKKLHVGRTDAEVQMYVDLNPMHVTNLDDGRIVLLDKDNNLVLDNNGKPAYEDYLTSKTMDFINQQLSDKEQIRYKKLQYIY